MRDASLDLNVELTNRNAARETCWFPGLARKLIAAFWADGWHVEESNYCTALWLDGATSGRPVTLRVPGYDTMAIEPLPPRMQQGFIHANCNRSELTLIEQALEKLALEGVAETVLSLVRSIHVVASSGPGYDRSHSDPTIPFSILLSLPAGERHATLRVAESLLHEAMHLQLTLIERHVPTVTSTKLLAYSPWQDCQRPVHGVLHGLYVFTAIYQWLTVVSRNSNSSLEDCAYADRRRVEIENEIAAVSTIRHSKALTHFGQELAASLLDRFPLSRIKFCEN